MFRLVLVVFASLFAISQASADNFQLIANSSPAECLSSGPPNLSVLCISENVLVNTNTSAIYRCFGKIWLGYDETKKKFDSGGRSACYLEGFENYPKNPGKSNYSIVRERVGPEPQKRPSGVTFDSYAIAKSERFSFIACMELDVEFPAAPGLPSGMPVGHADCIEAKKPVAITTQKEIRLLRQQMMQDRSKD